MPFTFWNYICDQNKIFSSFLPLYSTIVTSTELNAKFDTLCKGQQELKKSQQWMSELMAQMQATMKILLALVLGDTSTTPQQYHKYEEIGHEDNINLNEYSEKVEVQEVVIEIEKAKVEEPDPN